MEMEKKFLNELNYELRALKKAERIKCLNDYKEIIADRMEAGMSESEAVAEFGSTKEIAQNILSSYVEMENSYNTNRFRSMNKLSMIIDMTILVFSYVVSYIICYQTSISQDSPWSRFTTQYVPVLLLLVPCYFILYYIFHLYEASYICRPLQETWRILSVNVIGIMLLCMGLYFTFNHNFARIMILDFFLINTALEMVVRRLVLGSGSRLRLIRK